MEAANDDPLKRAVIVDDEAHEQSHAQEGDEEGNRGDKHAAARAVRDGAPDEKSKAGELEQHEQYNDDQAGKGQKQECSGSGHILLKH